MIGREELITNEIRRKRPLFVRPNAVILHAFGFFLEECRRISSIDLLGRQ